MRRALTRIPEVFALRFHAMQEELKGKISAAKKILRDVTLHDDLLRTIASTCIDLGVKTHRAEIVITRTAKTIAAFEGRTEVNQEDVKIGHAAGFGSPDEEQAL